MPNLALRGISDELHQRLKAAAKRNHRSLNGEILARLEASVPRKPVDPKEMLERIQRRRESLGPIDTSPETIRELREHGRP